LLNARYTDQDVRESPDLREVALMYLKRYQGDFIFLVRAKNYLEEHDDLPVATIRGVLNCMRADPTAAMLLPQTGSGRYEDERPPGPAMFGTPWYDEVGRREPQRTRPAVVKLKTTWHVEYALSTHATAQVYHILRLERSYMEWLPHVRAMAYHLEVWCGYPLGWSLGSRYKLSNSTEGRRVCKLCHKKMLSRSQQQA
jgi:hypothetical protein